jgi:hypothetical protein
MTPEEIKREDEIQEIYMKSIEGIRKTIQIAKDSVWVIESEIQKKTSSEDGKLTKEGGISIQRNVEHLELVLSKQHIMESGEDLSELQNAVIAGKAALAE